MKNHELGQGALELVFCIKVITVIFAASMIVFYSVYSKSVISYQLQKTILCTEKLNTKPYNCLRTSSVFLKNTLWFHKKQNLNLDTKGSLTEVIFSSTFFNQQIQISKKIEIKR